MKTSLVRITKPTWQALKQLSKTAHRSMQSTMEEAIELYRRQLFFKALNVSSRSLRANPKAWQEELEERKIWEVTLQDGLEENHQEARTKSTPKNGKKHV